MPLALRLLFWIFVLAWVIVYASYYPLANFLWTCNVGLLLAALGVALGDNRFILSVCLIMVALPDLLWTIDFTTAWLTGEHPLGGTAYMFDSKIPRLVRLFSLEHFLLTPILIGLLWRQGYEPRALPVTIILVLALYYLTYWLADPATQVNWVWGPFGRQQSIMPQTIYPLFAALVFSVIFLVPSHWLARWLLKSGAGPDDLRLRM